MSAVCNKMLALGEEDLRDKKHLALSAGTELTAATSELCRALELAEHGDGVNAAAVYAAAARDRLDNAARMLARVGDILATGTLTEESASWYRRLDYDRLYRSGLSLGQVPHSIELWQAFARQAAKGGPVAICRDMRGRTVAVAALIGDWLERADGPGSDGELLRIQSAMADLAAYAQFVAFANKVEPRDPAWLTPLGSAVA
ncbi:hypothetical protein DEJ49_02565 [Streptomyces venezuelae]|uniref:Uncharacterized protein n=1 Tax=Streptomyces venezuelae TaxID=54571 RepID=A0A5P2CE01_STRVZ|nr:hypothetical protein [Streptomyces venezuelae]QES40008.1 hypothetical protein DEJ49_02565 [Streptomyces venezuelae]